MTNKFRHYASEVRFVDLGAGVIEATYSGPMTQSSFDGLRGHVLRETAGCKALVIRMDRCLLSMSTVLPIPGPTYALTAPPAAVVCRREQSEFGFWRSYVRQVARLGISRVLFCEDDLELARDWAWMAASRPQAPRAALRQ